MRRRPRGTRPRSPSNTSPRRSGGTPGPTLEIAEGSVADQIAQVAERADVDLVVLGLRGAPDSLDGARVGSVAYRVLCASPAPVLAVPHEARGKAALAFLGVTDPRF